MKTSPRHSIVLQLILMLAAIIIPSCGKGVDTSDIMMLQQLEEAGISTSGFVDLGLSVKWAACPGGADRPWYVAEILYSDEMESYLNNHLKPN